MKLDTIHGLPVIDKAQAKERQMNSLTTSVHARTEADIMRGIADRRDPQRFAWVRFGANEFQLFGVKQNSEAKPL